MVEQMDLHHGNEVYAPLNSIFRLSICMKNKQKSKHKDNTIHANKCIIIMYYMCTNVFGAYHNIRKLIKMKTYNNNNKLICMDLKQNNNVTLSFEVKTIEYARSLSIINIHKRVETLYG